MNKHLLTEKQVADALAEINKLAEEEYGLPLEALLTSNLAEERLLRLSGVLIKRPFAKRNPPGVYNPTNANYSWHWNIARFSDPQLTDLDEYKILKEIRDLECNESWSEIKNMSHEAGLMWAVGKWLTGQIAGEEKTFRDCYYDSTSPGVNLLVNFTNLIPFASLMAGVVGGPLIAVQLSLFAMQFGYEKLTEVPPMADESPNE